MLRGIDLTKSFESCAVILSDGNVRAYWDALGAVWTIGWGTTGNGVESGTIWSKTACDQKLQDEWNACRNGVLRASPILAGYPDRCDACTDFAYNLGIGAYQTSTLRRYVNQQRWTDAGNEFGKWNHAGGRVVLGLTRRRAVEKALFLLAPEPVVVATQTVSNPAPVAFDFGGFLSGLRDLIRRFFGG